MNQSLTCKHYFSENITDKLIEQLVQSYRYIFTNTYFKSYLVFPGTGQTIKTNEFFNTTAPIPLSQLDSQSNLPKDSTTQEQAIHRYNTQAMLKNFTQKLQKDALLITQQSSTNNNITGFVFGYKRTIKELFELEEWHYPILYSGSNIKCQSQTLENFLHITNQALEQNRSQFDDATWQTTTLTPQTQVFVYAAIGIMPQHQRLENFYQLNHLFYQKAAQRFSKCILVAENKKGSTADLINRAFGAILIDGFFTSTQEPTPSLVLASLDSACQKAKISFTDCLKHLRNKHTQATKKPTGEHKVCTTS